MVFTYQQLAKRTNKVMKTCRKYLIHVQRSVFEGKITEAKLEKLKKEIKKIYHEDEDSVMIYKFDSLKYSTKEVIGLIMANDNIL